MNKKLVYALISLLVITVVSAALVTYLSNTLNITMTVNSPFSLTFRGGGDSLIFDTTGGSTINYTTYLTNNANNNLDTYKVVTVVTSPSDWEGGEFDSYYIVDDTHLSGYEAKDYLCHIKSDGSVIKFSDISIEGTSVAKLIVDDSGDCSNVIKYNHPSNITFFNNVSITFNPIIIGGDYSVKLCHLYSLTGSCS